MDKSERIKQLRSRTKLSQAKFGALFKIPAINISLWENGRTSPPEYVVYMMDELLNIKGWEVAHGEEDSIQRTADD